MADIGRKFTGSIHIPPLPQQHTLGHVHCAVCEASKLVVMQSNYNLSPELLFPEAAKQWLDTLTFKGKRGRYISERSLRDDAEYINALTKFFGTLKLREIHLGHIEQFHIQRSDKDSDYYKVRRQKEAERETFARQHGIPFRAHKIGAGPNKINKEISVLIRILKRANLWTEEMQDHYQPLQYEENDVPRAMSPEEQNRFLEILTINPKWHTLYCYSLINLRAPLSTNEMRRLQISSLNTYQAILNIRWKSSKNIARMRTIPLTDDAVWAAMQLLERAKSKGSSQPQHYIFPFRVNRNTWDPTKPMSVQGFKREWDEVRVTAGVPWLRPYDLRHTCATRLAEAGVPVQVIRGMMGHLSRKMEMHYTHISEQAQRRGVNAACRGTLYELPRPDRFPNASAPDRRFSTGVTSLSS